MSNYNVSAFSDLEQNLAINKMVEGELPFEKLTLKGLPNTPGAPAGYGDLASAVLASGAGVVVQTEQSGTPPAPNFVVYPAANSIDPNTQGSSIWGVGGRLCRI